MGMMRQMVPLFFLTMLVVACAPSQSIQACEAPYIRMEFSSDCCLDADADGVCDSFAPPVDEEIVSPPMGENVSVAPPVMDENISEENRTKPAPAELPLTVVERYEVLFKENVKTLRYRIDDPVYGRIWVLSDTKTHWFVSNERLFFLDARKKNATKSSYDYRLNSQEFIQGVEERQINAMNYVVWDPSANRYRGCFVKSGRYGLDNCILDYPNNNPVEFFAFAFTPRELPTTWLDAYRTKTPILIRENRTLILGTTRVVVDEVTFENRDRSKTVLFVHSALGLPLQRELFSADGKLVRRDSLSVPGFNVNIDQTHESTTRLLD